MRRATRRSVPGLLVTAVLAGGCGAPAITDEASAALETLVDATWDAAEAGKVDAARGHLEELRVRAGELHEDGDLEEERLGEVLAAADAVEDRLGVLEGVEPEPQEPAEDVEDEDDDGEDDEAEREEQDEEEREEAEEEREKEEKAQEEERKREEKEREKEEKEREKEDDD